MININTNISSLIAQTSLKNSTNNLNKAVERLTTGSKINHAQDNAANYGISTNMTTCINAYMVAEDNALMGVDMLTTAEESLSLIYNHVTRLRDLAEQASNGTYGEESIKAINSEARAIVNEIKREYSNVEYNGIKLFTSEDDESITAPDAGVIETAEKVSEATTLATGKTYLISSSADIVALQNYVNTDDVDTTGMTFELVEDIDMSGVDFRGIGISDAKSFKGTFNGNGHTIKNLEISTGQDNVGFFGYTKGATIDSVVITGADISGQSYVGTLVGYATQTDIENCSVKTTITASGYNVGGLVGKTDTTTINKSGVSGSVTGAEYVGGFIGDANTSSSISNSYSKGSVKADTSYVGGFIGTAYEASIDKSFSNSSVNGVDSVGGFIGVLSDTDINNSYSTGNVNASGVNIGGFIGNDYNFNTTGSGNFYNSSASAQAIGNGSFTGVTAEVVAEIENDSNLDSMGFTEANGWVVQEGRPYLDYEAPVFDTELLEEGVFFQVGIDSTINSVIGINLHFDISSIDDIIAGGLTSDTCIANIDSLLSKLTAKSVEYGSAQNRLESALNEISIKYENLVSSRSTLKDADVAEISSQYIREQILQQASATLLSTANQAPAIALQLI